MSCFQISNFTLLPEANAKNKLPLRWGNILGNSDGESTELMQPWDDPLDSEQLYCCSLILTLELLG